MASVASVIATLNPHRLSHMPMARRVCRSSSTTKMRRMTSSPLRRRTRSTCLVSHPCQKGRLPKGTTVHPIAGSFALRISVVPQFCRKSPACLPSTVYKAGSTTRRHQARNCPIQHATRRAVVARDAPSGPADAGGIVPSRLLRVLWRSRRTASVVDPDRAAAERSENTWHGKTPGAA